ncbi:YgaP-like transmembrane domain [Cellulomonas sp. SG140]|uniref:YgaP-like transmembrane domain n=1 Tax=Cellulomonas sp. SG140 TaxID=2976536 RepID=UPI0021E6DB6E|nr:YgaP-like transmembrane domain [Cellulomonas sp. SG140]
MGSSDRVVRLVAAVVLVVAALLAGAGTTLGVVLLVVAAVLAVTSAVGFCPLYRLFGLSTVRRTVTTR